MSNEVPEDDLPDNLVPAHDLPDEFNVGQPSEPVEPPTWYEQAGHYAYENVAKPVGGAIGMGLGAAGSAYNAIPGHDVATGLLAYKAAPHLYNKATAAWEGAKSAGRALSTLATPSAPVAPGPNPAMSPNWSAPAQQAAKPSIIQQGSEYARDMQRIAAQKVKQMVGEMAPTAQRVAGAVRPIAPAAIGAGAMLYSPGLNQNEDEELARRRQMGFQGGR